MYSQLKKDMNAAGIKTSPGGVLTVPDMVAARGFCHFKGKDFDEYVRQARAAQKSGKPSATSSEGLVSEDVTEGLVSEAVVGHSEEDVGSAPTEAVTETSDDQASDEVASNE